MQLIGDKEGFKIVSTGTWCSVSVSDWIFYDTYQIKRRSHKDKWRLIELETVELFDNHFVLSISRFPYIYDNRTLPNTIICSIIIGVITDNDNTI